MEIISSSGSVLGGIQKRETLEHVESPVAVMQKLVRAGEPGALYLLAVPGEVGEKIQQQLAPEGYFKHPNHVRILNGDEFAILVEESGLVIESTTANALFWVFWMCMHWIIEIQKRTETIRMKLQRCSPKSNRRFTEKCIS